MLRMVTASLIILIIALAYIINLSFVYIYKEYNNTAAMLGSAREAAEEPAEEPKSAASEVSGRVVILDAGHDAEDTNTHKGYDEHATMLALSYKIKPRLEGLGFEVMLTRPSDDDVPRAARCAEINKRALLALKDAGGNEARELDRLIGIMQSIIDGPAEYSGIYFNAPYDYTYKREIHPDLARIFEFQDDPLIRNNFLVISLHSNATPGDGDTRYNGVDIYYISNDIRENDNYFTGYTNVRQSFYFGTLLIDRISKIGLAKRKVLEDNFFMLREHNLPAVLVENGFHTNQGDREKLQNETFLDKLAAVYAETILYYFDSMESEAGSWYEKSQHL